MKLSKVDRSLKEDLPSPNDGVKSVADNKETVFETNSDKEDDCVPDAKFTVPRDM